MVNFPSILPHPNTDIGRVSGDAGAVRRRRSHSSPYFGHVCALPSRPSGDMHPVRIVLHWAVRALLLLMLLFVSWQSVLQYRAQPVLSTPALRRIPFPRLTVCSGSQLNDYRLLRDSQDQLLNGTITLSEYYNRTTLELLQYELTVGGELLNAPDAWKQRYYLALTNIAVYRFIVRPMRCHTFDPTAAEQELRDLWRHDANGFLTVELTLVVSPHFANIATEDGVAYHLYVHGAEVPNVGDLKRQWYREVPITESIEMKPGWRVKHRVSAKVNHRVNVRRQKCDDRPGHSEAQCIKECLWESQAATMLCRYPHMVSADAYLPEIRGPSFVDEWPECTRLMAIHNSNPHKNNLGCRDVFLDPRSLAGDECAPMVAEHTRPVVQPSDTADGENGECPLPEVTNEYSQQAITSTSSCKECLPACETTEYRLRETVRVSKGSRCTTSV